LSNKLKQPVNKNVVKSILRVDSSYPRALSKDDWPPVRISEKGKMRHFTTDKNGNIIPYVHSLWFLEERYRQRASIALMKHARLLREKRNKLLVTDDEQVRRQAAATAMMSISAISAPIPLTSCNSICIDDASMYN
jgi:hypothetical protein